MAFKTGGNRNKNGWVVISGRRSFGEIFHEYIVLFIVLGATLISAALTAYLYFAGPLAVSRYKEAGLAAIRSGDYFAAAQSLEKADKYSFSKRLDILYLLGTAYFTEEQYADAIGVFNTLITLFGGEIPYRYGSGEAGAEPSEIGGNVSERDILTEYVEKPDVPLEAFLDAPALPRVCYFLAEAYAYTGDSESAYDVAYYGFFTTGDVDLLTLAETVRVETPISLTASGVYNGRFVFRFEPTAEGIRTFYRRGDLSFDRSAIAGNGFLAGAVEYKYTEGIEIDIGDHVIHSVNVNRYGQVSDDVSFMFTVLDAAGNINGNIINGAIAVERGDEVFYFNGAGIYKETTPRSSVTRLVEGNDIGCLNLLGEWLYFARAGSVYSGIYKIRVDGTGLSKVSDTGAEYLQTMGNKLYFTTREGLCSMPPDGGEITLLVEGNISGVNYGEGKLYFIMELPYGNIDDAGPVYSYEIYSGEIKKLIDGPASFLQVYDDRLYYTQYDPTGDPAVINSGTAAEAGGLLVYVAELDGSPSGRLTLPFGATGVPADGGAETGQGVNAVSVRRGFLIDTDTIYYFDDAARMLRSIDAADAVPGLSGTARARAADLAQMDQCGIINIAAGDIYGYSPGGETGRGYFRAPAGRNGLAANPDDYLSDIEDISSFDYNGSVHRYGDKLYYIDRDANGEQYVYPINTSANADDPQIVALTAPQPADPGRIADGLSASAQQSSAFNAVSLLGAAMLSGIPEDENIVYINDYFIVTSDYVNARIYTLPDGAQNADGAQSINGAQGAEIVQGAIVYGSALHNHLLDLRRDAESAGGDPESGSTGEGEGEGETGGEGESAAGGEGEGGISPSGDTTGTPAGGETADIEAAEATGGGAGSASGENNGGGNGGDNGDGDRQAEPIGNIVEPETLTDNGMHMWHGLSRFRQYGDRLYFTSQAGFFSADSGFTKAAFICADGPEIGEDFVVKGNAVVFKRGAVSGEGGLYMLDLDSGVQKRIYGGIVAGFDIYNDDVFYTDAGDGVLYMQNMYSESPAVRIFGEGELPCDVVICRGNGSMVVRSPENGYALYTVDIGDIGYIGETGEINDIGDIGETGDMSDTDDMSDTGEFVINKLTLSGAGAIIYYGDFIYYEAWDMPGLFFRIKI